MHRFLTTIFCGSNHSAILRLLVVPALVFVVGCGGSSGGGKAPNTDDSDVTDAGMVDSGGVDSGGDDSAEVDSGEVDSGVLESGTGDPDSVDTTPDSVDIINEEKLPVRIMVVGDSISHGVRDPIPSASWRLPFTMSMDQDGCAYEMVGSQQTNELHDAFISAHEAYAGHQAGHFITGHTNYAGTNEGIFIAMENYSPDVVLMHLGTNDAVNAQSNQETVQEIDQLVATILDGDADVLVANVIPAFADDTFVGVDARIADLGTQIEAYVAQLGNSQVQVVDVKQGFTSQFMYPDGIHPNKEGSQAIADAFYAVYKANNYCE